MIEDVIHMAKIIAIIFLLGLVSTATGADLIDLANQKLIPYMRSFS
jgi:type III secretory pathway component EscS